MRIAMWSGPRNLSTAMMYSFASRSDCAVWDEPFYAPYLALSGAKHPLRNEIIAAEETDPHKVVSRCIGDIPEGKEVFYQKHMPHHMLPAIDRGWIREMVNVFLIRDPVRVLASYHAKLENPTLEDIGVGQQEEIFQQVADWTGQAPVVVDCQDILRDPSVMMPRLCAAIGLEYQPAMLSWPKGGHRCDGAWAPHWYGAVWNSTGFAPVNAKQPIITESARPILDRAQAHYNRMQVHKL